MIGSVEEVDEELLSWIVEAAEFAKKLHSNAEFS